MTPQAEALAQPRGTKYATTLRLRPSKAPSGVGSAREEW